MPGIIKKKPKCKYPNSKCINNAIPKGGKEKVCMLNLPEPKIFFCIIDEISLFINKNAIKEELKDGRA